MPRHDPVRAPRSGERVRYAVVGLGHIAQGAVLPAFRHARENSRLVALVSDSARKRVALARKYRVEHAVAYGGYDTLLRSGAVDAVYIALPNDMHRDYAVRAARAGIHVLCEKPMAISSRECRQMIDAAARADVRLMIAYRLHFDRANLEVAEAVRKGKLGRPRAFSSDFCMQVRKNNIRTDSDKGGGPLADIGIYCINAARAIFAAEPTHAVATSARAADDPRFREVPEMVSAILHFPGDRLATFTCSFGAYDTSRYTVVGTTGRMTLESAYEYKGSRALVATKRGRTSTRRFAPSDQFAPQLLHFSECVLTGREPAPSGQEGASDVSIIKALEQSIRLDGRSVAIEVREPRERPALRQAIRRPPVGKVLKVDAPGASRQA